MRTSLMMSLVNETEVTVAKQGAALEVTSFFSIHLLETNWVVYLFRSILFVKYNISVICYSNALNGEKRLVDELISILKFHLNHLRTIFRIHNFQMLLKIDNSLTMVHCKWVAGENAVLGTVGRAILFMNIIHGFVCSALSNAKRIKKVWHFFHTNVCIMSMWAVVNYNIVWIWFKSIL